jgi:hypothetical protein
VGDNNNFVASVDKFGRELIYMAFNAAGLGEKEVADHSDVVRHGGALGEQIESLKFDNYAVDT